MICRNCNIITDCSFIIFKNQCIYITLTTLCPSSPSVFSMVNKSDTFTVAIENTRDGTMAYIFQGHLQLQSGFVAIQLTFTNSRKVRSLAFFPLLWWSITGSGGSVKDCPLPGPCKYPVRTAKIVPALCPTCPQLLKTTTSLSSLTTTQLTCP